MKEPWSCTLTDKSPITFTPTTTSLLFLKKKKNENNSLISVHFCLSAMEKRPEGALSKSFQMLGTTSVKAKKFSSLWRNWRWTEKQWMNESLIFYFSHEISGFVVIYSQPCVCSFNFVHFHINFIQASLLWGYLDFEPGFELGSEPVYFGQIINLKRQFTLHTHIHTAHTHTNREINEYK